MNDASLILLVLGSNPWAIALAIVFATFILEDAAIVGAALLAASGAIPSSFALGALTIGIFLGDIGLYGLGFAARRYDWAKRYVGINRLAQGHKWLSHRLIPVLVGARFLPGLRLPIYAASGFFRMPFLKFAATAAAASSLWSATVFILIVRYGTTINERLGAWTWLLAGFALLLVLAPTLVQRRRKPTCKQRAVGCGDSAEPG